MKFEEIENLPFAVSIWVKKSQSIFSPRKSILTSWDVKFSFGQYQKMRKGEFFKFVGIKFEKFVSETRKQMKNQLYFTVGKSQDIYFL